MSATRTRQRMGDLLVDEGLIDRATLDARLDEAAATGTRLGRILMTHGDISRQTLFDTLATSWGLRSVDLLTTTPVHFDGLDPSRLLAERWVPVTIDGDDAVVAVCDEPDDALRARTARILGVRNVTFAATTDWDIEQGVLSAYGEELVERAAYDLAQNRPHLSAADPVTPWQKAAGLIAVVVAVAAFVANWRVALMAALVMLNVAFFAGIVFKLVTCAAGARALRRDTPDDEPDDDGVDRRPGYDIADADLPIYTILVPAFHEANVVTQVVENISSLDYPLAKLQVLVLCEADDHDTIAAAKAADPPDYVRLVVVPAGGPQTKPKACNVGLDLADGEYLVIYDAEDHPEPGQLREAVAAFNDADERTVCVQARLNYHNTRVNFLTRMFTLEYSAWFDYMLPGLDRLRLPIPLGGTSNHFRVSSLRELGGWDPYNVTEDADLGLRASAEGHHVGIISSTTWEEACSDWKAFIRQRTRWIKGYMVTAAVHLRHPYMSWRRLGWRGWVGLLGLIAGTPALFLAAPLVWAFFAYTFLGGTVADFSLPGWLKVLTTISLLGGNTAMIALSAFAAKRRKNYRLIGYAVFNPAYWVLHSIAAWRALYQLVVSPSHWEKTPHGITHGPHA